MKTSLAPALYDPSLASSPLLEHHRAPGYLTDLSITADEHFSGLSPATSFTRQPIVVDMPLW
jgi:hypothetical protein